MLEYLSQFAIGHAFLGGILIGLSATILLLALGRIAGICGISFSLFRAETKDKSWRLLFIVGLVAGTLAVHLFSDISVPLPPTDNIFLLIAGGFITGFGTQLGNGCTSGHGVCGISRLSVRSIVATLTFMSAGFITVYIGKHLLGAL